MKAGLGGGKFFAALKLSCQWPKQHWRWYSDHLNISNEIISLINKLKSLKVANLKDEGGCEGGVEYGDEGGDEDGDEVGDEGSDEGWRIDSDLMTRVER